MKKDIRAYRLEDVLVNDAYCVHACEKDVEYLLSFDTDRLLAGFYENAGLVTTKMRYSGWENMLIGGHTLGHFLSACAQGAVNPMCKEEEQRALSQRVRYVVDELMICQEHSLGKPGFLFGAVLLDKSNVELQFDNVEKNRTDIFTQSWVPWYTMHKILDGLLNVYELLDYEPALFIASRLGDWTYERVSSWSKETHQTVLGIEYGGMNDALYELYLCTKDEKHLFAAHMFDEESLFVLVAKKTPNVLRNLHANTTIPKFLGALNRYIVLGDKAKEYLQYAEAFWDMVQMHHTYITGGNSEWEHFGKDDVLDLERTNCNNETCNTYNMLKLSKKLFQITGKKKYADYYENTLINAIFSSQNPQTGMHMYFQPMATGYFKTYSRPFDQFWCCAGTGLENFTKLGESIYYETQDGILVNLYLSSILTDRKKGIRLVQSANLPEQDTVSFTVLAQKPVECALSFRIPDWAFGYQVLINEEAIAAKNEDGFLYLHREWKNEDRIKLSFNMKVVAFGLKDAEDVFAFKYGPVVLSANLGTDDMVETTTGVDVTIPKSKKVKTESLTIAEGSVASFITDIDTHFEKDLENMRFTLKGTDWDLVFGPHYKKYKERYGIYWYLKPYHS